MNVNNDRTLEETHIKAEGKVVFNLVKTDSNKMLPKHLLKLLGAVEQVLFSAALLWSPESGFVLNINGNSDMLEIKVGLSIGEIFKLSNVTKIQDGVISNETSFSEGPLKLQFTDGGKVSFNREWSISFGQFEASGSMSIENLNYRDINSNTGGSSNGAPTFNIDQRKRFSRSLQHHQKTSGRNNHQKLKKSFNKALKGL